MDKLYEKSAIFRSKNAGPFITTIDILFNTEEEFLEAVKSKRINTKIISESYNVNIENVRIYNFPIANAIKIVFPRKISSGAPGDKDVYGAQQASRLENVL